MQKRIILLLLIVSCSIFALFIGKRFGSPAGQSGQYQHEAARISAECSMETCYEEKFKILARTKGLIFAEQTLYKLWDLEPTTRRCHLLAHVIAREAIRKDPDKWKEYFETVNYGTCSAGFLHGLMEAHIGDIPDLNLNSEFANELCLKGEYYRKHNCIHYMGHLLMVYSGGNVDQALDGCEGIKEGLDRRCYTGVFMEDSFPLTLVDHKIRPKLSDRRRPEFVKKQEERCRRFEGYRSVACWTDMGENYGVFFNDPRKVYDACFKAPGSLEKHECFLKAAGLFAIHPDYSSSDKLTGICKPPAKNKELYKKCVGRVIPALLYYSLKFADRATSFCSNAEEWYRQDCFEELDKKMKDVIKSQGGGEQPH